ELHRGGDGGRRRRTRQYDVAVPLEEGCGCGREQVEAARLLLGRPGFQPRQDRRAVAGAATGVDDDDGTDQDVGTDLLQPAVADRSAAVLEAVEATAGLVEVVRRQVGGFQRRDQDRKSVV